MEGIINPLNESCVIQNALVDDKVSWLELEVGNIMI